MGEIFQLLNREGATTVVVDDDLSSKQLRGIEDGIREKGLLPDLRVMDRTSIILEIFAKHARYFADIYLQENVLGTVITS